MIITSHEYQITGTFNTDGTQVILTIKRTKEITKLVWFTFTFFQMKDMFPVAQDIYTQWEASKTAGNSKEEPLASTAVNCQGIGKTSDWPAETYYLDDSSIPIYICSKQAFSTSDTLTVTIQLSESFKVGSLGIQVTIPGGSSGISYKVKVKANPVAAALSLKLVKPSNPILAKPGDMAVFSWDVPASINAETATLSGVLPGGYTRTLLPNQPPVKKGYNIPKGQTTVYVFQQQIYTLSAVDKDGKHHQDILILSVMKSHLGKDVVAYLGLSPGGVRFPNAPMTAHWGVWPTVEGKLLFEGSDGVPLLSISPNPVSHNFTGIVQSQVQQSPFLMPSEQSMAVVKDDSMQGLKTDKLPLKPVAWTKVDLTIGGMEEVKYSACFYSKLRKKYCIAFTDGHNIWVGGKDPSDFNKLTPSAQAGIGFKQLGMEVSVAEVEDSQTYRWNTIAYVEDSDCFVGIRETIAQTKTITATSLIAFDSHGFKSESYQLNLKKTYQSHYIVGVGQRIYVGFYGDKNPAHFSVRFDGKQWGDKVEEPYLNFCNFNSDGYDFVDVLHLADYTSNGHRIDDMLVARFWTSASGGKELILRFDVSTSPGGEGGTLSEPMLLSSLQVPETGTTDKPYLNRKNIQQGAAAPVMAIGPLWYAYNQGKGEQAQDLTFNTQLKGGANNLGWKTCGSILAAEIHSTNGSVLEDHAFSSFSNFIGAINYTDPGRMDTYFFSIQKGSFYYLYADGLSIFNNDYIRGAGAATYVPSSISLRINNDLPFEQLISIKKTIRTSSLSTHLSQQDFKTLTDIADKSLAYEQFYTGPVDLTHGKGATYTYLRKSNEKVSNTPYIDLLQVKFSQFSRYTIYDTNDFFDNRFYFVALSAPAPGETKIKADFFIFTNSGNSKQKFALLQFKTEWDQLHKVLNFSYEENPWSVLSITTPRYWNFSGALYPAFSSGKSIGTLLGKSKCSSAWVPIYDKKLANLPSKNYSMVYYKSKALPNNSLYQRYIFAKLNSAQSNKFHSVLIIYPFEATFTQFLLIETSIDSNGIIKEPSSGQFDFYICNSYDGKVSHSYATCKKETDESLSILLKFQWK